VEVDGKWIKWRLYELICPLIQRPTALIYATADEADAYMFYRCFFLFFPVFLSAKKIPDNRSREWAERIFTKLLPNDSGGNVVFNVVPKCGLGPINLLGAKNSQCALGDDDWRMTQKN